MSDIITLENTQSPPPACEEQWAAHQATYALRISIVDKLNTLQALEHEALEKLKTCSRNNTERILNILKRWLSDGYSSASQADIDEVDRLSDIKHARWCDLARSREIEEAHLVESTAKSAAAKESYRALDPGLLGRFKMTAEEKERLKAAEQFSDLCNAHVKDRKVKLDEIEKELRDDGRKFIESCCKSMALVTDESDLGSGLSKAVAVSKHEIAAVWAEHCQNQRVGLAKVNEYIATLNSFYREGE